MRFHDETPPPPPRTFTIPLEVTASPPSPQNARVNATSRVSGTGNLRLSFSADLLFLYAGRRPIVCLASRCWFYHHLITEGETIYDFDGRSLSFPH